MRLIGHRGARGEAPENTEVGFSYLRSLGINSVELDIQLSKDDELMVIHDASLNRTCNGAGNVRQWLAADLAQLNATQSFPGWSKASGVPRFADVLAHWPELEHIQIEVKSTDTESLKKVVNGLRTILQPYQNHPGEFVITSSDVMLLKLAKQHLPQINRGYVAQQFCRDPIAVCDFYQCSHLILNQHRCSYKTLTDAQLMGLHVSCWTVNDIRRAKELRLWGVDSLITDVPQKMLDHVCRS